MELKDRFPDDVAEIDAYFEALLSAEEAGHMVGAERAMPEPFHSAHHWWNKRKIQRWCSRTTGEVIAELITDPKLAAIARGLVPVIEAAGGSARAGTPVSEILLEDRKAVGVRTRSGEEFNAPFIVSAIGAGETVKHLLPVEIREQPWAREIATFKPSICHFEAFLSPPHNICKLLVTRNRDSN